MATGIILAGGASSRMLEDKAFLRFGERTVIEIQLEQMEGLFEEVLVIANTERVERLAEVLEGLVRVVEEPVRGKGPLGGILSGLTVSSSEKNFVLACDIPYVKHDAIAYLLERLEGYDVAVPRTPEGLEPLHAAYNKRCAAIIEGQLGEGDLKVTDFYGKVKVNYIEYDELAVFDSTGMLLTNVNSPEDVRRLDTQD
jgi:molybdopterin-guanine dinucleotide biosynthesis protein A